MSRNTTFCFVVVNPRAYDQMITISPSDHTLMLIVFCILFLTYLPWPGSGAIWTRSTKKNPDGDELRELAGSGDGRKSKNHRGRLTRPPCDRRVSFVILPCSGARRPRGHLSELW